MSTTRIRSRSQIPALPKTGAAASLEGAWDVLERFGQALQACDQAARQVGLVLEAVRESLGADTVYWFAGSGRDQAESVGSPRLPEEWCRDFTCRVVAENPEDRGQMVCSFLDPAAKPATPWPCSAALVRVSASRGSWLGALSFHPRRIFLEPDLKVVLLARRMLLSHRQHVQVQQKLKDSLSGLVRCLTAAIDAKDPYTWGHSERVGRIAVRLGKQLGLSAEAQSELYLAGLLHDIGKISVRDTVLQKHERLSDAEMAEVQQHPLIGDRLVAGLPPLHPLRAGVRHHHERWDGRGYPDRLKGEEIPLQARILAVADSCDAMMAARPYRAALTTRRIETEMSTGAGRQWDPRVVEAFRACRHAIYSICQRGSGDAVKLAVENTAEAAG